MNRIEKKFRGVWAMALLGVLLLAPLACKKQPFVETVKQTLYLGMPGNLDSLASLDIAGVRSIDGFNDLLTTLENQPKFPLKANLDSLRQKVGFDPIKDLGLVVLGSRSPANATEQLKYMVFIAQGNFQNGPAKLEKLSNWLGEEYLADVKFSQAMHASGIKRYQITGKSQYDVKVSMELNFAFPTDEIMVFSFSAGLLNDTLDVITGQTEGIQKDKAWLEMLKRVNRQATFWMTGVFTPADGKDLAEMLPDVADTARSVKQLFFDADFTPEIALHVGLVCETIDSATKLSDKLNQEFQQFKMGASMVLTGMQVPETGKLLNAIKILNELETVRVSLTISPDNQRALRTEWAKSLDRMKTGQGALGLPALTPGMMQPGILPQGVTPTPAAEEKPTPTVAATPTPQAGATPPPAAGTRPPGTRRGGKTGGRGKTRPQNPGQNQGPNPG